MNTVNFFKTIMAEKKQDSMQNNKDKLTDADIKIALDDLQLAANSFLSEIEKTK
jgi:hypothetical protein